MQFDVVPATKADAAELTEIAHAAKRHWGYPPEWMEAWRAELTIEPAFLEENVALVARAERALGFAALSERDGQIWLQHIWVRPEAMGQGVGRALFTRAMREAAQRGFGDLEIEADPNALPFYEHMGAKRVGTAPGNVCGTARDLPLLRVTLARKIISAAERSR